MHTQNRGAAATAALVRAAIMAHSHYWIDITQLTRSQTHKCRNMAAQTHCDALGTCTCAGWDVRRQRSVPSETSQGPGVGTFVDRGPRMQRARPPRAQVRCCLSSLRNLIELDYHGN